MPNTAEVRMGPLKAALGRRVPLFPSQSSKPLVSYGTYWPASPRSVLPA